VASLLFAHLSVPPFAFTIIDGSALSSLPFSCLLLGGRGWGAVVGDLID
jgi:hypothetical protein